MKFPETDLQIAFANYMRLQYPKVLHIHVPNERKTLVRRNKKGGFYTSEGSRLKRMGVISGVSDNLIFEPSIGITHIGLAIELKIKPNKPTEEQLIFLSRLSAKGWKTAVCYTLDEAIGITDSYFGREKSLHTSKGNPVKSYMLPE